MAVVLRSERFIPNELKVNFYQDINVSQLFNKDTNDLSLLVNEDSVKHSIINILLTNVGEKFFNINFGSEVNKILFENLTPQTTAALNSLIKSAIENYEPRANLLNVISSPLPDDNAYAISIVFNIINKTEPITLDFVLNRVR